MLEYRGIAVAYSAMRGRTLALRQESIYLPAREALLEFMIRLSLGRADGIKVPKKQAAVARDIRAMMRLVGGKTATVEDAAEATLRIYARLARVKNDYLAEEQFIFLELADKSSSRSKRSSRSNRWEDKEEIAVLPELTGREREYLAPQGVDYRGEFRPELAQLLTKAQANSREQRKSLTPEELADLLRSQRTPKPRDGEDDGDEQDPQTSQMVQNLLRELDQRDPRMQSVTRRPSPSNDDDSGPLSATQPNTFIYDEWDAAGAQLSRTLVQGLREKPGQRRSDLLPRDVVEPRRFVAADSPRVRAGGAGTLSQGKTLAGRFGSRSRPGHRGADRLPYRHQSFGKNLLAPS